MGTFAIQFIFDCFRRLANRLCTDEGLGLSKKSGALYNGLVLDTPSPWEEEEEEKKTSLRLRVDWSSTLYNKKGKSFT